MRVLFCESLPMWSLTLPQGFRALGYETAFSGPITRERLQSLFFQFRPDLVVSLGWGREHSPEKIQLVREAVEVYGVVHAYWALEDPNYFEGWSLPYIRKARPHLVFTICPDMVGKYRKQGFAAEHLDFACNPDLHRTVPARPEYVCDMAVVGNSYWGLGGAVAFRNKTLGLLLKPLLNRGYRFGFWGTGWQALAGDLGLAIPEGSFFDPLPYEETVAVYNSAAIVLGLQNSTFHLTQRTFEVLGAGGFLLTVRTQAVERLFSPGWHLAAAASADETVALAEHYLANVGERRAVARNGQAEVYERHTYRHRAARMLELVRGYYPLMRVPRRAVYAVPGRRPFHSPPNGLVGSKPWNTSPAPRGNSF